jgi:tripartite-type tricarboxylate transporter receptor subunit TctC
MGQQVLVENRAGASAMIGTDLVAKSPADGYTLLFGGVGAMVLRPTLDPKTPYNVPRDFAPVSHVVNFELMMIARKDLPAQTLKQFVAQAKAEPGKFTIASSGAGGPLHMSSELFKIIAGIDTVHVPYKGEQPAVTDVVGGRVDAMVSSTAIAAPMIRAGKLKALAIMDDSRSHVLPDVPTVVEEGFKGYELFSWVGIFAPAGTDPAIVDKLSNTIAAALKTPDLRERLIAQGLVPVGSRPAVFAEFLKKDRAKWEKLVRQVGLTLDAIQ